MPISAERTSGKTDVIPWEQRPHLRMTTAADVTGLSPSTIYRLAAQGKLTLRRIAGRVVVETAGVAALVRSAEPWTPSDRGAAGRARRSELSRAAWR